MKSQALKGMRDLLPAEQTLRDYIQGKILETYRRPAVMCLCCNVRQREPLHVPQ